MFFIIAMYIFEKKMYKSNAALFNNP